MKFDTEERGRDLISAIARTGAFITLNLNPVQLRSLYEALALGCPIVVLRTAFMDELKNLTKKLGVPNAVQIVTLDELNSGSKNVRELTNEDSEALRLISSEFLDSQKFGEWFGRWVMSPKAPASYYEEVDI